MLVPFTFAIEKQGKHNLYFRRGAIPPEGIV